ncbi:MAG: hypothetical protein IPG53_19965 [Ignavibacteriales bacterium]|nr:hypothetical protein [Ignavibacteriales bacterium]
MADRKKVTLFLVHCRQPGIEVLSPDVNTPGKFFTVKAKKIRFGLTAIKMWGNGC